MICLDGEGRRRYPILAWRPGVSHARDRLCGPPPRGIMRDSRFLSSSKASRMFPLTAASFLMLILVIVAFFGAAHLMAASHADSTLSKAWLSLGF